MNNFGVVELAGQRRSVAPGWAYVPESRNNALLPPGFGGAAGIHQLDGSGAGGGAPDANKPRKRAARSQAAGAPGNSLALFSDLTSRQETKLRKELEILHRDMGAPAGSGAAARDAAVPIPQRAVKAQNKYTPNVRKILASQKTFANHLDDFNAFNALHQTTQGHLNYGIVNEAAASAAAKTAASTPASTPSSSRRPARKDKDKDKDKDAKPSRSARSQRSAAARRSTTTAPPDPGPDTPMPDAQDADAAEKPPAQKTEPAAAAPGPGSAILCPYAGPAPPAHALDSEPLLASAVPPVPTDDELRALVAGPPLPYPEARAALAHPTAMGGSSGVHYPARVFCDICGYWGRVKCTKCGTPVCALDCLELHRQECITRYGL